MNSLIQFIENAMDDTRPYILPGNVQELINRHITHSDQAIEAEKEIFPGPYKIVLMKKRVRLPIHRRVMLQDINTGRKFTLGLKKIRRIFRFIPEPDYDQMWEKTKQLTNIK